MSFPAAAASPLGRVRCEVRFTVESKPFGIDLDMVERDGDIYVVKAKGEFGI